MTKADLENGPTYGVRKAIIAIIAGIMILFLLGVLFGLTKAMLDNGAMSGIDFGILISTILAIVFIAFGAWKLWPIAAPEPIAPSAKKSRNLMIFVTGIGFVMGMAFALSGEPGDIALFSNGPINPTLAASILFGWLIIVPLVSWVWWKSVDEHEAAIYLQSSAVAAHVYFFLAPSWWLASRAGWVPAQDPMIVCSIVIAVWSAFWLYRKYA
uniref:hypothetical protein n=1 Tax=uncultured Erythrobacter sp. TaxID=263913 RepID=UPI00260FCD3D|nr:hypothetical protein [uncultured Erythrobacter sp.]